MSKREDYISWDEYFMGVALLAAKRSKDPNTQVGACIVNENKKIMSVGYNGFPLGCSDDSFPWDRTADNDYDTKYPYVCHAELSDKYNGTSGNLASKRMFDAAGVEYKQLTLPHKEITINFDESLV